MSSRGVGLIAVCWRQREQIRPTVLSSVWKGEFGVLYLWHRILDRDPLCFINCQFILPSVVELGRLKLVRAVVS
jgi:hypothetical protein